jgi:hypothetical protein
MRRILLILKEIHKRESVIMAQFKNGFNHVHKGNRVKPHFEGWGLTCEFHEDGGSETYSALRYKWL